MKNSSSRSKNTLITFGILVTGLMLGTVYYNQASQVAFSSMSALQIGAAGVLGSLVTSGFALLIKKVLQPFSSSPQSPKDTLSKLAKEMITANAEKKDENKLQEDKGITDSQVAPTKPKELEFQSNPPNDSLNQDEQKERAATQDHSNIPDQDPQLQEKPQAQPQAIVFSNIKPKKLDKSEISEVNIIQSKRIRFERKPYSYN